MYKTNLLIYGELQYNRLETAKNKEVNPLSFLGKGDRFSALWNKE